MSGVALTLANVDLENDVFAFIEEIAKKLPIRVLGRLLGVPEEDLDPLPRLADMEATGSLERVRSHFTNALKRMPVRVTPA